MRSALKGAAAELLAAAFYASVGFVVFTPLTHDTTADLVCQDDAGLFTVQVKSAVWASTGTETEYLRVSFTTQHEVYRSQPFDYLAIVAEDGRIWEIPFEEALSVPTLYLDRRGGNKRKWTDRWGEYLIHGGDG